MCGISNRISIGPSPCVSYYFIVLGSRKGMYRDSAPATRDGTNFTVLTMGETAQELLRPYKRGTACENRPGDYRRSESRMDRFMFRGASVQIQFRTSIYTRKNSIPTLTPHVRYVYVYTCCAKPKYTCTWINIEPRADIIFRRFSRPPE